MLDLEPIKERWAGVAWKLRTTKHGDWLEGRPVPFSPSHIKDDRAFLRLASHAPTDIAALLSEVERLREENERLRGDRPWLNER